jgi:hypothetical protein
MIYSRGPFRAWQASEKRIQAFWAPDRQVKYFRKFRSQDIDFFMISSCSVGCYWPHSRYADLQSAVLALRHPEKGVP